MSNQPFTIQTYSPNSDLAAGFNFSQLIWGRTGNDVLLGLQPQDAVPGFFQIDLLIGDVALDDPDFRQWNDTFILGDWQQPYYANGNSIIFGLNDFALIADFDPNFDSIQLNGNSSLYQLLDIGIGSVILRQQLTGFDTLGFLIGSTNLDLNSSYFNFQGFTPPPGPTVPEAKQIGTPGFEIAPAVTTDPFGNVYVAGGTTGNLAEANFGNRDGFISKYDNQGSLIRTQQVGTAHFDTIYGAKTDLQGNLYVAGITEGDLGNSLAAETSDAWVAKYAPDGEQLWIQQFGQNIIFQAFNIDVDAAGNSYITGLNVKAAPEPAFVTDDFWASKFDTNGNQIWFTEVGTTTDFDESYNIAVSNDGSVYITGWTLGDLGAPNAGVYDAHITKFDNDGNVVWIRQFGTSDYEWGWGIDTDSQGNVIATGWTLGDLFGTNAGSYDGWLTKYDSTGNQIWATQFGSSKDDQPFSLFVDVEDNIFLTGYTTGDLGNSNAGSFDAWAARYDSDGNQVWVQQFGTALFDQAYSITGDNLGNLFVTGTTSGSLGASNAGSFDAWIAKLDATTGKLVGFNGTGDAAVTLSPFNIFASNSNDIVVNSLAAEEVTFITSYLTEFLQTSGIEVDGSGLTAFLNNPYSGGQPTPIPEPSYGMSLLVLFICARVGLVFKRQWHRVNQTKLAYNEK